MKNGWTIKSVSELAHHSLGKMLDKAKNKGEPKPYLRNLNVRWFDFDMSDVREMRFLPSEADRYTAVKGDVLVCEGGYPGRAAIWVRDEPIHFQKALHRVRFHEPAHAKWFVYYLHAKDLDGTLKAHFGGAGIQHFTGEALARFEVPVPPLAEQRRIVGILDEAFEGISIARASAERSRQNALDVTQRAVELATTGRLTQPAASRSIAQSSDDLLSAIDRQRRASGRNTPAVATDSSARPALPRHWRWASLDALCIHFSDSAHRTPKYQEDGIPALRPRDVVGGRLSFASVARVSDQECAIQSKRYAPVPGDIVYSRELSYGWAAEVPDSPRICLSQGMCIFRPATLLDRRFLLCVLNGPVGRAQAARKAVGAAHPHINLSDIKAFAIPVPPLGEQKAIVTMVQTISGASQRLLDIYDRKLAALDELKKSLLHRAFAGAL